MAGLLQEERQVWGGSQAASANPLSPGQSHSQHGWAAWVRGLNYSGNRTFFLISKHASHFLSVAPHSFADVVLGFYLNINSGLQTVSIPKQKWKMERLDNALEVSPDLSFNLRGSLAE